MTVAAARFVAREGRFEIALPGARVVFTAREGGVSATPYDTLNLGLWTDDDPAAVAENRRRAAAAAGVEAAALAQGRQVHGAHVERRTAGAGAGAPVEADGQATAVPGVAPIVLVADCLPIAVAGGGAVAMLHGGWRGLAAGIVAAGVQAVRDLGAADARLEAAIGPGARGCCYEAGDEVHAAFADLGPEVRDGRRADLPAVARRQLEAAGVAAVHDLGLCTLCAPPGLLFSHRRDGGVTGRQGGIACLS